MQSRSELQQKKTVDAAKSETPLRCCCGSLLARMVAEGVEMSGKALATRWAYSPWLGEPTIIVVVEVRDRRFLQQYKGKDLKDPLLPYRDIQNISGATMSVEAIGRGSKKALALLEVVYFEGTERK